MEGESETIVRYARLAPELKPVQIFLADTLRPIDPDWVAITHAITAREGRVDFDDNFCMHFLTDDGRMLAYEQFDTLEIALDRANAIAGIPLNGWGECHIKLPETLDDERITWAYVA